MRFSKRIRGQDIARGSFETIQDIDRLSTLLKLLQPAKKLFGVVFDHVVETSDIGFGKELRDGASTQTVVIVLNGCYDSLRGAEVRQGPGILIPLLAYFAAVDIIEVWIVDMDSIWTDADDRAILVVKFLYFPQIGPLLHDIVVKFVPGQSALFFNVRRRD